VARGRLITFEGVEGCGKTTQLLMLDRYLKARGETVVTTREPGGTPLGEGIRRMLLDPSLRPTPLSELFLLEAARAQLVADVIVPALDAGSFVLSDRFADSSLAYQGGARHLPRVTVEQLNTLACAGLCLIARWCSNSTWSSLSEGHGGDRGRGRTTDVSRTRRSTSTTRSPRRTAASPRSSLAGSSSSTRGGRRKRSTGAR
jgi:hypothetical protein